MSSYIRIEGLYKSFKNRKEENTVLKGIDLEIEKGDILVIHDTGAHGFAMGYNYNGKLKSAELLLREDGSVVMIRRAETVDDYFATLDNFWNVIE